MGTFCSIFRTGKLSQGRQDMEETQPFWQRQAGRDRRTGRNHACYKNFLLLKRQTDRQADIPAALPDRRGEPIQLSQTGTTSWMATKGMGPGFPAKEPPTTKTGGTGGTGPACLEDRDRDGTSLSTKRKAGKRQEKASEPEGEEKKRLPSPLEPAAFRQGP